MARYNVKIVNNTSAKITTYYYSGGGGTPEIGSVEAYSSSYIGFTDLSDKVQLWSNLPSSKYEYDWSATPKNCWNISSSTIQNPTFKLIQAADNPIISLSLPKYYTILIYKSPSDGGTVLGAGEYKLGSNITISATPTPNYYEFSKWSDGGSQSHSIYVGGNKIYTAYFSKIKYTLTYWDNSGSHLLKSDSGYEYNEYATILSVSDKYKPSTESVTINSYFKPLNGEQDIVVKTGSTQSYSFNGWSTSTGQSYGPYQPGGTIQIKGNTPLSATYKKDSIAEVKISSIPGTQNKLGYSFDNWWTSEVGGIKVEKSIKISDDSIFYAHWIPKNYSIVYSLNPSSAKWPEQGSPDEVKKTYGTPVQLTSIKPTRFGYDFVGWHSNKEAKWDDTNIIKPSDNAVIDDRFYTDNSITKITLYPIWKPIDQKIICHYYNSEDKEITYTLTYNIESGTVYVESPDYSRGDDWVFSGWLKRDPSDVEWKQEWTQHKGVYRNLDEAPQDYYLPYEIYPEEVKEWDPNYETHLYGLWSITGKYININNSWKKVTVAYLNSDGTWIPLTGTNSQVSSFSVKIETTEGKEEWKEEVH